MRAFSIASCLAALVMLNVSALPVPLPQDANGDATLSSRGMKASRITYYSGQQLAHPACGGPTPSRNAMIAAVKDGGRFSCGDNITIKHKKKKIQVKVVDFCESCSDTAVDLTPGAFARLADLSDGVITGAQMWVS